VLAGERGRSLAHCPSEKEECSSHAHLVTCRDEILERGDNGQACTDGRFVQVFGAGLTARGDDLLVQSLRTRERLFVRRHDVDACAQECRVRLSHGRGGRVVDQHDGVVFADELPKRVREVGRAQRGRRGGAEKRAPVGRRRYAAGVIDCFFGRRERDEAEGMRRRECLQLSYELGAD
jgi:hypothetical protein